MATTIIEQFVEEVTKPQYYFTIFNKDTAYYFFCQPVGNARYYYLIKNYNKKENMAAVCLNKAAELVAIVANQKVFILNESALECYREPTLPKQAVVLRNYLVKINNDFQESAFSLFIKDLETTDLTEDEFAKCQSTARYNILCLNATLKTVTVSEKLLINEKEIVSSLSGFTNINELMAKKLEDEKDNLIRKKSLAVKTNELIKSPDTVTQEWERKMANGLYHISGKTVLVEFCFHNKRKEIKISLDTLYRKLFVKDYFSEYDFLTYKEGTLLLNFFDAGKRLYDKRECLTCEHIQKIGYRGKVYYEKQN